jgi:ATP-binding cassette subfamily C (CFTR/MRP) protein 1
MGVDMGNIVRDEFGGYTIVTVSHRLDAMGDVDVVVRMDNGRVVEVTKKDSLSRK